MQSIIYKYCPMCATPLIKKAVFDEVRPTCPNCDFVQFFDPKVVTVVVVEHEGKIMLGKRNIDPGRGMWSIPGGYVNRGERLEAAAVREIKEETNLDVQIEGLIGLYSEVDNPYVLIVYRASVIAHDVSEIARQPEEVSELAFFSPGELPELAFPSETKILLDWGKLNSFGHTNYPRTE